MPAQGRKLASAITIALNVAWWFLASVCAATAIAVVLGAGFAVQLGPDGPNLDTGPNVTMAIPVTFSVDTGFHRVAAPALGIDAVEIRDARGTLRFPPPRRGVFFFANVALVLGMLAIALWVIGQLRALFRTVRDGQPFAAANAARVRRIAWVVILGEIARTSVNFWESFYAARYFAADGLSFVARPDFNMFAILNGVGILVIAEVFRAGTRLDEDQSLTV